VFNSAFARLGARIQSRLVRDEEGATAVEYGLIVGLVAVVIIAAVILLGQNLNGLFGDINDKLAPATP
jgi:pilus assembly protein Flp/PilA